MIRRYYRTNPGDVDFAAIANVYQGLGAALAIGKIATHLGIPGGQQLIDDAQAFTDDLPNALGGGALETGGVLTVAEEGAVILERTAAKAAVESEAKSLATRILASPVLIQTLGKVAIAGGLFVGAYAVLAERIDAEASVQLEAVKRIPPEQLGALLKASSPFTTTSLLGSLGLAGPLQTVLIVGTVGIALVIGWKVYQAIRRDREAA